MFSFTSHVGLLAFHLGCVCALCSLRFSFLLLDGLSILATASICLSLVLMYVLGLFECVRGLQYGADVFFAFLSMEMGSLSRLRLVSMMMSPADCNTQSINYVL